MSGYTEAFQYLLEGNYTRAITHAYTDGLKIGNFFYLFIMFALILPIYIKTRSIALVAITIIVLAGAGLTTNIVAGEESLLGPINFMAIFALFVVVGFTILFYKFLRGRE